MHPQSPNTLSTHPADAAALAAEHAIDATRRSVNEALDGLSGAVESMRGQADPALSQLAARAGAMGQSGLAAMRQGTQRLTEQARQSGDDALRYVHHKPVTSLLMAAAAGAAVATLTSLWLGRRPRE